MPIFKFRADSGFQASGLLGLNLKFLKILAFPLKLMSFDTHITLLSKISVLGWFRAGPNRPGSLNFKFGAFLGKICVFLVIP